MENPNNNNNTNNTQKVNVGVAPQNIQQGGQGAQGGKGVQGGQSGQGGKVGQGGQCGQGGQVEQGGHDVQDGQGMQSGKGLSHSVYLNPNQNININTDGSKSPRFNDPNLNNRDNSKSPRFNDPKFNDGSKSPRFNNPNPVNTNDESKSPKFNNPNQVNTNDRSKSPRINNPNQVNNNQVNNQMSPNPKQHQQQNNQNYQNPNPNIKNQKIPQNQMNTNQPNNQNPQTYNNQYQNPQYQNNQNPQYQKYPNNQYQNTQKPQYQNNQHQNTQNPQYQNPQYQNNQYQNTQNPQYQNNQYQTTQNPQYQTPQYQNNQNQNSNQNQNQGVDYIQVLNKSQNLFFEGNDLMKNFCFIDAITRFDESLNLAEFANSNVSETQNKLLKDKIVEFIRNIKKNIDFCNFQDAQKYSFKEKVGFAQKKDKVDYLNCIRYDDKPKTNLHVVKQSKSPSDNKQGTNTGGSNDNNIKTQKGDDTNDKDRSEIENKILSEILDSKPGVMFDQIYGLEKAKQALKEIIILPTLRPDLFTGLRAPPRGLLLFGPPGTGKTMIAKAVATECQCTFFSISSSSLTSKYVGDSEKLVRSMFDLANEKQPSIVFIDEIDSILSKRSDNENEASKRLKTEFLVQFDGVGSDASKRVLIIGATNRPFDLDNAVLRRLAKRIYIGPFDLNDRVNFLMQTMKTTDNKIEEKDYSYIGNLTSNYSNSDLKELCREAACEPIRDIKDLSKINEVDKLRPVLYDDFLKATKTVRGTLTHEVLKDLEEWNKTYGVLG